MGSEALRNELKSLKEARKQGQLSAIDFYKSLLQLLSKLANELGEERISDDDVKKQIPLILAFLEEQISKYAERGG